MILEYWSVLVDTWWYWANMEWYWLIYDGTGSVEVSTGLYTMVLGSILGDTWSYLVVLDQ